MGGWGLCTRLAGFSQQRLPHLHRALAAAYMTIMRDISSASQKLKGEKTVSKVGGGVGWDEGWGRSGKKDR